GAVSAHRPVRGQQLRAPGRHLAGLQHPEQPDQEDPARARADLV
ncbi:MAG: hypothetical protein AVDCRST_MAG76-380, partial [uncultured Acidimicrobiales bacterium]